METILILGLSAGFWAHLLTKSQSMPKWWYSFQKWWGSKSPFGNKPFGCPLCMSFWTAVFFTAVWYAGLQKIDTHFLFSYLFDVFASTALSILYIAVMEKLETFVIG